MQAQTQRFPNNAAFRTGYGPRKKSRPDRRRFRGGHGSLERNAHPLCCGLVGCRKCLGFPPCPFLTLQGHASFGVSACSHWKSQCPVIHACARGYVSPRCYRESRRSVYRRAAQ